MIDKTGREAVADYFYFQRSKLATKERRFDDGLKKLLRTFGVHRKKLLKIWVDGGYRGVIIEWVKERFRYCLEVVLR